MALRVRTYEYTFSIDLKPFEIYLIFIQNNYFISKAKSITNHSYDGYCLILIQLNSCNVYWKTSIRPLISRQPVRVSSIDKEQKYVVDIIKWASLCLVNTNLSPHIKSHRIKKRKEIQNLVNNDMVRLSINKLNCLCWAQVDFKNFFLLMIPCLSSVKLAPSDQLNHV